MGGGGGSSFGGVTPPTMGNNPYLTDLGTYSGTLWNMTQPMRESIASDYIMPFLKGNYNMETLPGFKPAYDVMRTGYEDQYNVAKQNIEASTPRGGSMTNALAGNEYNRAKNIGLGTSQLGSTLASDLWNKAYNTGYVTSPGQVFAGTGAAAGLWNDASKANMAANMQAQDINAKMNAAESAQANQGKSSGLGLLGTGLGSFLGMAAAPKTGGTSLIGSGMSALSGLSGGKGGSAGSGITSGLGGYSDLMSQANPLSW